MTDDFVVEGASSAAFLWDCREARQVTQQKLAKLADSWQSSVSDIETGRTSPTVATLKHLLDAMGLELVLVARHKKR